MDFSELSHQREIRESLNKIFSEKCSPEKLKEFDNEFKHDENLYDFLATNGYLGPVSYTHLTLPTIYSV